MSDLADSALLDGRYRVLTKIASGGTSTVYRGLNVRLDRLRQPTRQLTRGPRDWPDEDRPDVPDALPGPEYRLVSGKFAGIDMGEVVRARQHAQRMAVIWVAVVLAVIGLVAAAAWTIGSNLSGLL
jgi:serine/threonine-protein kinase